MFRNQYDSDITTWSPAGRIHQIEYAMEAVKQGSAAIGLKSKTHAVLVTLKKTTFELGSYQNKLFRIDDHIGIAISGITADARVLCKYMRNETLNHKFVFESPMQTERLVLQVADKSQVHTQRYGRRPYGVGLLVIGYDQTGPHLFENCPSGNYYDFKANAIGSRSQSAKTYLEKHFNEFENLSLDELIRHGLLALRETAQSGVASEKEEQGLTTKNVSIAIVGKDKKFEIIEEEALLPYLQALDVEPAAQDTMEV
eukprot:TRINITY_DN2877_c0_g1_i1.p1 TRINITY_DN2877_c0_g1~~TRINITY_DN2877_c0_g1_i1.p1  ORF type:complete len:256 (+),score=46.58 TRINITY_DN2877_c0_g1_i1:1277-2044(+)